MKLLIAIIGILLSMYLGTVLGIYSLCVESPSLSKAKKHVFFIPFFLIFFILSGLFGHDKERRELVLAFLRIPHKSLIMLGAFACVMEKETEKKSKYHLRKIPPKRIIFGEVLSQLSSLFHNGFSIYY